MEIRRAVIDDIEGLDRLLFQVLTVHHRGRPDLFKADVKKYSDAELTDILNDDRRPVFVCVDENNTVLGYAFCIYRQHFDSNILTDIKTLYIDDICVDENVRGKHIGKEIYEYVLQYERANGFYNVTLNVWSCNPGAVKFYESMGLSPYRIGMEQIL